MFQKYWILIALLISSTATSAQFAPSEMPKPTAPQLAWQKAEIGVLISYDLPVFQGTPYNQAQNRITPFHNANIFNPTKLNTDQWIQAAKAGGAKFAVLTVTHETGFALYQSDANPYCMKAIKFQNGKGDIVRDFVNSCRKYGVEPGIYVGIRWNSYLGVHDFKIEGSSEFVKRRQAAYKNMCEQMVTELCTRFGKLFMIWFDGGADDPSKNGPNILPIVTKYQPNCLFYHNAQKADFRWGGSESGTVPYPSWSTFPFIFSHAVKQETIFANNFALLKTGDPAGKFWMPAMSDAPLRGHKGGHDWFWNPNEDHHVNPLDKMMKMYYQSVGHNSTLILGITPDNRGLIPNADVSRLKEWGDSIKKVFKTPVVSLKPQQKDYTINIPVQKYFSKIVLQENIQEGERVRAFVIEASINGEWKMIKEGSCIGHKYIGLLDTPVKASAVRLIIKDATSAPMIKTFTLY
jgi:alpha-L-fucosidase